jgi:hypothetical protein
MVHHTIQHIIDTQKHPSISKPSRTDSYLEIAHILNLMLTANIKNMNVITDLSVKFGVARLEEVSQILVQQGFFRQDEAVN